MSSILMSLKTIISFSFPAIVLISLIANSLSFYIFSRKSFQNTVFSIYFRFYLVFQTLNLIMPINKMFELNLDSHFSRISDFTCKIRYYYLNLNYSNCSWLLVVVSLDRYMSISYPAKFMIRKKSMFQILTCCLVILFNACFFTSSLFYHLKETNQTNQTAFKINIECVSPGIWFDFKKILQQILIPFIFMILFSLLTVKNIYRSRKITSSSTSKTINNNNDRKFTFTSIVVNILFLIFNFPYYFILMIQQNSNLFVNLNDLYKFLEAFTHFLLYINLGFTFFINYFVNSMFKKEIEIILNRKL